ncbi:CASC3/Barentsz eIF4AIII binding [Euphorbia peplus]|nr:CASC3/Barentsz eIF4AIII binding [Euphorbia peplus]
MPHSQTDAIHPDDYWTPWSMRRRQASDDDDEDTTGDDTSARTSTRAFATSDDDSDSAGRPPEDAAADSCYYYSDDEDEEQDVLVQEKQQNEGFTEEEQEDGEDAFYCSVEEEQVLFQDKEENEGFREEEEAKIDVAKQIREQEPKSDEREAVIVPSGVFYMHDDRFESRGNERRLTSDRRNLWQFKDQEKWQHDKFEELENQRFNAGTKVQTIDVPYNLGYPIKKGRDKDVKANRFKPNASYESYIVPSRIVRGRGPVKYKPLNSNNCIVQPRNKDLRKLPGEISKPFESSTGLYPPARNKDKLHGVNSNAYSDRVDRNSSLAHERLRYSASSCNPNLSISKKKGVQSGKVEGYFQRTALPGDNTSMAVSKEYLQRKGKTIADSSGRSRRNDRQSINPVSGPYLSCWSLQPSMPTYRGESSQSTSQTRTKNFRCPVPNAHQSPSFYNVDQVIPTNNNHVLQQAPAGYTQRLSTGSGINSGTFSLSGTDLRTIESFARPRLEKTALSKIESWINQCSRRSHQLGGTDDHQVVAPTRPPFHAVQHRDQYIVDGQNADRALDRSVGFTNSGMTWMPALPDDVGFPSSHYVTPNGNPHMFPLVQESSTVIASNEADTNQAFEGSSTQNGTEDVNNQSGNQRSKFQRYSKMNFDPKPK